MIYKYIRTNKGFITFAFEIKHDSIVVLDNIISAGFFVKDEEEVICYGKSTSLNVGSLNEDSELLAEWLREFKK